MQVLRNMNFRQTDVRVNADTDININTDLQVHTHTDVYRQTCGSKDLCHLSRISTHHVLLPINRHLSQHILSRPPERGKERRREEEGRRGGERDRGGERRGK